jgi:hypothetical protein
MADMKPTNAELVARQNALLSAMQEQERQQAISTKAIVSARQAEDILVDPVTKIPYRELAAVLDMSTWNTSLNAANAETVIAEYIVPNGLMYYFRGVRGNLDRNAPHIYALLKDGTGALLPGTAKIEVKDSSGLQLKGLPWNGSIADLASAAQEPTYFDKKLFFNSVQNVKAQGGDRIRLIITSSNIIDWSETENTIIHLVMLTQQ